MEQFEMEQLVYTQDGIYFKTLNETNVASGQKASEDNFAGFDSRIKYPEMLRAYYEVYFRRQVVNDLHTKAQLHFISGSLFCTTLFSISSASKSLWAKTIY